MKNCILVLVICLVVVESFAQTISYEELINKINTLESDGNYKDAKEFINASIDKYDNHWFSLSKELVYVNEKLGLYEENLAIFCDAHKKGYFYFIHPAMPKYNPYKQYEEFAEISKDDIKLLRAANESSNTIYDVQLPDNYSKESYYPMIILLHGGGRNLKDVKEHWQTDALNKEYIKVYVQSYRHFDSETYGWGSADKRLEQDLERIYKELLENYSIDTNSILMGSISAGANPVIELSLRSLIPVKGFILFCPDLPIFIKENKLEFIKDFNVKAIIVSGENDHFIPKQKTMIHVLDSLNISNNYTIVKNMGHQYPDDENYYITEGLKYINDTDLIKPELKEYIKNRIEIGYNKGISIGIIDTTGINYYNYGSAFNTSKATPTKNTIYEIGSVCKIFTTSLYSILLDLGEVGEDDKVGDFFKRSELTGDIRNIKLMDLATHTSGLPSFPSNLDINEPGNFSLGYKYNDFFDFLNDYKIPEERIYNYSNSGIALLAIILERITEKKYSQLLKEYIFDDLKMTNTFIEVPKEQQERFADGSSLGVEKEHWNLSPVFVPVGGLKSTGVDLIKFLSANMHLVDYPHYNAMANAKDIKVKISDSESSGIGWRIKEIDQQLILWHNGNTGGFSGFIGFNSSNSKGVVVLSNSNANVNEIGWKLLDDNYSLKDLKNHVCFKLVKLINEYSLDSALNFYSSEISKDKSDYILGEMQLAELANAYITKDTNVSEQIYEFALDKYASSININIAAVNFYKSIDRIDKAKSLLFEIQKQYPENVIIANMIKELEN